jgi:hypothetical protein
MFWRRFYKCLNPDFSFLEEWQNPRPNIQKAETVVLNVARGQFPGEY